MISRIACRLASMGAAIAKRLGGPKIGGGSPVGAVPPPFQLEEWLNTSNGESLEERIGQTVTVGIISATGWGSGLLLINRGGNSMFVVVEP